MKAIVLLGGMVENISATMLWPVVLVNRSMNSTTAEADAVMKATKHTATTASLLLRFLRE